MSATPKVEAQAAAIDSSNTAWLNDMLSGDDNNNSLPTIALATIVLAVMGLIFRRTISGPRKILPLQDFINVPLIKKEVLSHDTCRFTFGLPDSTATLGLPTGQHLTLKFFDTDDNNKAVQRSYTPVTDDRAVGYFSIVTKIYKPLPPKFPAGGKMSQHLNDLRIREIIQIKGPKGHMTYEQDGKFQVKPLGKPKEQRSCQNIGMMAGGTGITPMLQLLHAIFDHPVTSKQNSNIRVKLLYANQTPGDILVRPELESLVERFPERFQLYYTVDRVDDDDEKKKDWKYGVGFITTKMVEEHLIFDDTSNADGSTQFFMCGPPPMIKFACVPALTACGYTQKDWVTM